MGLTSVLALGIKRVAVRDIAPRHSARVGPACTNVTHAVPKGRIAVQGIKITLRACVRNIQAAKSEGTSLILPYVVLRAEGVLEVRAGRFTVLIARIAKVALTSLLPATGVEVLQVGTFLKGFLGAVLVINSKALLITPTRAGKTAAVLLQRLVDVAYLLIRELRGAFPRNAIAVSEGVSLHSNRRAFLCAHFNYNSSTPFLLSTFIPSPIQRHIAP